MKFMTCKLNSLSAKWPPEPALIPFSVELSCVLEHKYKIIWNLRVYLLKNWHVSFYVINKNCHIQKIVCVDET